MEWEMEIQYCYRAYDGINNFLRLESKLIGFQKPVYKLSSSLESNWKLLI
jgi:hypothetical protein